MYYACIVVYSCIAPCSVYLKTYQDVLPCIKSVLSLYYIMSIHEPLIHHKYDGLRRLFRVDLWGTFGGGRAQQRKILSRRS